MRTRLAMRTIVHDESAEASAHRLQRRVRADLRWTRVTLYGGLAIFGAIVIASCLASVIAPYRPDQIGLEGTFQPPSIAHLMGTDDLGRDVFSRVLYGTRLDIGVVLAITYGPFAIGVIVGALSGYFRGWFDTLVNRLVDSVLAFPFLVLVLALVAVIGPGLLGIIIAVYVVAWAIYARLARAEMLVLREQQFILAARALGYSSMRIVFRHALPNILRSSLVFSMADMVLNLLLLASVSFLGVGVQPPTPDLGLIISDGQSFLLNAWWITTMPGIVLVLIGVSVSMIGDGLADRLAVEVRLDA